MTMPVNVHILKGRVVTELIRRIRNKIKRYTKHEYIETVWGMGYKWKK